VTNRYQAVRGMNDFMPADTAIWQAVERELLACLAGYGYREIRMPLVERSHLFARSLGDTSDVVGKEMYSFEDRADREGKAESLSLRPEGTASCVRAVIESGMLRNGPQRLWYAGPMFRRERPQKGRYRQFHQFGVEAFGIGTPDVDIELIQLCATFWQRLGVADSLRLELNSLGSNAAREQYREILVIYFSGCRDQLDENSLRRLDENPLRILDSKNPDLADIIANAPRLDEHLDAESAEHFAAVRAGLDHLGIAYTLNPRLVRGLDYYNRTVFEWKTDRLGAQDAVCSGGRYDGLVAELGGQDTPASGFALGMERLLALLDDDFTAQAETAATPHVYLIIGNESLRNAAATTAEQIRDKMRALRLLAHCGGGSFKAQFKRADRSGAQLAVILGDDEAEQGSLTLKPLRGQGEQQTLPIEAALTEIARLVDLQQS